MKKHIKFVLAAVASVVFFAAVYWLYGKLSEEYKPQQNLVVEGSKNQAQLEESQHQESVEGSETDVSGKADNSKETDSSENAESAESAENDNSSDSTTSEEEQTNLAIDFVMENAAGDEVNLFDFVGKPIVLNFWASWCGPCKAEIPDFQAAYKSYEGEIEFLMVNMTDGVQETKETAINFIEEQGYTLPFYFDTQLQGAYTYGVYSLPTTFFINAEGEMIAYAQGMIDGETLEQGISMIYDED